MAKLSDPAASANTPPASKPKRRRGPGRPFPKGVSGNPGGRAQSLAGLVRAKTQEGESVVDLFVKIHRGEEVFEQQPTLRDAMQAAEWLGDRGFGKSTQPLEHSGPEGQPLVVEVVSYAGGGE